MTIDSHSYLVSRGWKGKGNALREGGISRPVVQAQKKDQKGLGRNRDDGFQFWDHVYAAAADAIKIHVEDSEEDGDDIQTGQGLSSSVLETRTNQENEGMKLTLTHTGILSNRRPTELKRVTTGEPGIYQSGRTGLDLLILAKREAAKRELYSRFYRGGIVHQEEQVDPLDCMGKVQKGAVDRGGTDDKQETAVDMAGADRKAIRREEKRKRKERKSISRETRKRRRTEGERDRGVEGLKSS